MSEVDGHLLGQRRGEQVGERAGAFGLADHEDLLDVRALGGGAGHVEERRHGHQQPGVGVEELVVDLALGVGGVDRGHHAAGVGDAVEDHGVLRQVRREDRQRLARGEPAGHEPAGEGADGVLEGAVGQRAAARAVDERGLVAELVGAGEDVVDERHIGDLDVGQRAAVDHAALLRRPDHVAARNATHRPGRRHSPDVWPRVSHPRLPHPRGALTGRRTADGLGASCQEPQRPWWTTSSWSLRGRRVGEPAAPSDVVRWPMVIAPIGSNVGGMPNASRTPPTRSGGTPK